MAKTSTSSQVNTYARLARECADFSQLQSDAACAKGATRKPPWGIDPKRAVTAARRDCVPASLETRIALERDSAAAHNSSSEVGRGQERIRTRIVRSTSLPATVFWFSCVSVIWQRCTQLLYRSPKEKRDSNPR